MIGEHHGGSWAYITLVDLILNSDDSTWTGVHLLSSDNPPVCCVLSFTMGMKTPVSSSMSSDVTDDRTQTSQLGLPETILQKLGFYRHPVLYVPILSAVPTIPRTVNLIYFVVLCFAFSLHHMLCFILPVFDIAMWLHVAIIDSTLSQHSCFSSCLSFTGHQTARVIVRRLQERRSKRIMKRRNLNFLASLGMELCHHFRTFD